MRVYSHTTVHNGEESYRLAIVESELGERRTVRLPDEAVEIGDWLELAETEEPARAREPENASP